MWKFYLGLYLVLTSMGYILKLLLKYLGSMGYEMARYKGTQASHLYEKSMHTLCTISEQPLLA